MQRIIQGVFRFQKEVFPGKQQLFKSLAESQNPRALFITCADSRVVPDLIAQTAPGDLFICRNAGNIIPPYAEMNGGVSATIEYAVMALKIPNIIVCGHSDCGAMRAVLHPEKLRDMPVIAAWLKHAESARRVAKEKHPHLSGDDLFNATIEENVISQIHNLRTHPSVAAGVARGTLRLYGWVYGISTGQVSTYDAESGVFVPLSDSVEMTAAPRPRRVREVA